MSFPSPFGTALKTKLTSLATTSAAGHNGVGALPAFSQIARLCFHCAGPRLRARRVATCSWQLRASSSCSTGRDEHVGAILGDHRAPRAQTMASPHRRSFLAAYTQQAGLPACWSKRGQVAQTAQRHLQSFTDPLSEMGILQSQLSTTHSWCLPAHKPRLTRSLAAVMIRIAEMGCLSNSSQDSWSVACYGSLLTLADTCFFFPTGAGIPAIHHPHRLLRTVAVNSQLASSSYSSHRTETRAP